MKKYLQNKAKMLLYCVEHKAHEAALAAVDEIRKRGWMSGEVSLLASVELHFAQLAGADLSGANLEKTDFLITCLDDANLQGANLRGASLKSSSLRNANLRDADLTGALLESADFTGASMRHARLDEVIMEYWGTEPATMPNGELWHADMDLRMFTDPDHPNFYDPYEDKGGAVS